MSAEDKSAHMKSAYEAALERLEKQGIERPKETALSDAQRQEMAEIRRQAEARIAELEILHRDRLKKLEEAEAIRTEEDEYRRERVRIEEQRERKIARLRGDT